MSAHAIAVFEQKVLLLLSDDNPNQKHPNSWGLIGGQTENNETPEETLLREFEEETTIVPHNFQLLIEIPEANTTLYLVELDANEASLVKIGNEGVALKFFSLSAFKQLPFYTRLLKEYPEYLKLFIGFIA